MRATTYNVAPDRGVGQRGGFATVEQATDYATTKARETKTGGFIRTSAGVSLYRFVYHGGPFESVEFIATTSDGAAVQT